MALVPRKHRKDVQSTNGDQEKLQIEIKIGEYLDSQGCVLWGQFFDIQSKEGRKRAQEFILDILIDLGVTNEMVEKE